MYATTTVTLKSLLDNSETREKIERAMSTYPLYEKKSEEKFIPSFVPTREMLNNKILSYYKYREIGFETIGRFIDELEISLNEIMPYYNQLFYSADQDYNLLMNVDYSRTTNTTKEGTSNSTVNGTTTTDSTLTDKSETKDNSTNTSSGTTTGQEQTTNSGSKNAKQVSSQTPQDALSIPASSIEEVPYADDVKWDKDETTASGTSSTTQSGSSTSTDARTTNVSSEQTGSVEGSTNTTANGSMSDTENRTETTKGNFGVMSSQDFIMKYRQTILNIEQQIINDKRIRELFLLVW